VATTKRGQSLSGWTCKDGLGNAPLPNTNIRPREKWSCTNTTAAVGKSTLSMITYDANPRKSVAQPANTTLQGFSIGPARIPANRRTALVGATRTFIDKGFCAYYPMQADKGALAAVLTPLFHLQACKDPAIAGPCKHWEVAA